MPDLDPDAPPRPPGVTAARLPLTVRALARPDAATTAAWGGPLGALPDDVRTALRADLGVDARPGDGADPLDSPVVAELYARARAEQVLLALSSRTNLVLAGTTALVVGDGPVADALAASAARIGVRIVRVTDDAALALRTRLTGGDRIPLAALSSTPAHLVLLTGEGVRPVAAADLTGVVADASPDGRALELDADAVPSERAGVRVDGATRVVALPGPLPADAASASGLQWRIADVLLAWALGNATEPDGADATLAAHALALLEDTEGVRA